MWRSILWVFHQRTVIWILFIVNLLGTIYGYYWYKNQLMTTDWQWWIFVPDSPTASLAFTGVLLLLALGRSLGWLEAFAALTLVKYGIWAVVMIILGGAMGSELQWQHWMLIASHLGMAAQAWIYAPLFSFGKKAIWMVVGWMLVNDFMDYGLDIHPWLAPVLEPFDHWIGVFTVLLTLTTGVVFLLYVQLRQINVNEG